jgi:hypothetical protein
MPRRTAALLAPLACLVALAGCGDSELSRGTTGAGIGAGAGAAICAVTIIGILPCAVAGGALGAAGGVATAKPDEPLPSETATAAPTAVPPGADAPAANTAAPTETVATPPPREGVTAEPLK